MIQTKLRPSSFGFALSEVLIGFIAFFIVVAAGVLLARSLNSKSSLTKSDTNQQPSAAATPTKISNNFAVLAPAKEPPKVAECSQPITFTAGGNSGPINCSNGDLNKVEWRSLATLEPSVLALSYNATAAQVQAALCADVHANVSNAIELTAYQIASLYYGWHFSTNPSSVITNGTCNNVDD